MTAPTDPWAEHADALRRALAVVEAELGPASDLVEAVATADLTRTFRERTDPAVADHTRVLRDGGVAFLDQHGRVVIAVSLGALPPAASQDAADFVVRHECQHAKTLLRGEEPRSVRARRGIQPQSVEGAYIGLAAELVDEFRAERATVNRAGPHSDELNLLRLRTSVERLDAATDMQEFFDAWSASVAACAYVAGEITCTGAVAPAIDQHPWIAGLVDLLRDQLQMIPDADEPFGLNEQDGLIEHIAALLPGVLAALGEVIVETDAGLTLEEIE